MKKLLLIIALFLSVHCFGQFTSYRNEVGMWNSYLRKWQYGTMNKANIPIHFYKDRIVLENKAGSVFMITEDLGEEDGYNTNGIRTLTHKWRAYDNEGKRCNVSMIIINHPEYDPLLFNVMYDDVLLRFYCRQSEYDRLLN